VFSLLCFEENISVQRAEHNIGDTLAQRKEHTKDR
jgi:hypothetical protein